MLGTRPLRSWAAMALFVSLLGCQRTVTLPPIEPPPQVSAEAKAKGAQIFAERCARCHGPSGWGDGPEALASKKVRVQDLGDPVWQSNMSNGRLVAAIVRGGPGVRKSAQMPAFPELAKYREEIDGLVAHIRSLARTGQ